jgi:hypothetical protein
MLPPADMQLLTPQERQLHESGNYKTILALRMLYATLGGEQRLNGYPRFIHDLAQT